MSRRWARYAYAASGGQKIYFSPRWSRPVAPRRTEWILPAYARAIFLKKTFIIGLSFSLVFAPIAPAVVVADDAAPNEPATESAPAEDTSEPEEEEPAEEEPTEEPSTEKTPEEASATGEEDMAAEPTPLATPLATPAPTDEEPAPAEKSTCDEGEPGEEEGDESLVESCNEAEVKTDTAASSDTGDNSIINEEPEATIEEPAVAAPETLTTEPATTEPDSVIDTGDAGAGATAVNDVNTIIVGTDVDREIVTKDGSDDEDVDLLESFVAGDAEPVDIEAAIDGGSGGLTVENGNEATVDNTVTATAETGDNAIEGGGDAAIGTGDASALAVAVNMVNTTLVGSNGLLAIVNIVGDYAGDVIVPGEGLLSYGDGNTGNLETVENDNEATIENTVTALADTGGNVIEESETASIGTGDASASAASSTIANTNFVGDNWLVVVINVFGEWLGGIVDGEDADGDGIVGFFFGGDGGGSCEAGCGDVVSVTGKNVAYVVNTVTATADTGGNTIEEAGDATIVTGDASATAAAFNFVNNNIIGSNWLLGIVNVFGSWSGNLVFAYPDLATSVSDGRDTALPGETLDYRVTVENRGMADAEDVSVAFRLPDRSSYRSASDGGGHGGGIVTWTLSGMKKGESKAFSVSVTIEGSAPDGADLRAYAEAATETAEKHPEDNASDDSTRVDIPARITGFDADNDPDHTGLRVRRSKPDRPYRGGEAITHWITVENTGKHDAYDVVVRDTFRDPDETTVAEPQWFLGEVESGEGLRIEYTIVIPAEVGAGEYRYTTRAEGREGDDEAIASKRAYALLSVAGSAFAGTFGAETAEAAPLQDLPISGEVQGAEAATIEEIAAKKEFPLWMLLLSGLAYFFMINWSFFPSDNRRNNIHI